MNVTLTVVVVCSLFLCILWFFLKSKESIIDSLFVAIVLSTYTLAIVDVVNLFVYRQAYYNEMSSFQNRISGRKDSDDLEKIVAGRVIKEKGPPYSMSYLYSGGKINLPENNRLFDWSFLLLMTVAPYIVLLVLLALIERSLDYFD